MADDDPVFRRGDIVIVDLDPTRGREIRKTRPCIVVQNDVGNRNAATTIVAPATTASRGYPFEVPVSADESDFEADSSVRVDQLRTVDRSRIQWVAGRIPADRMRAVNDALRLQLDLA